MSSAADFSSSLFDCCQDSGVCIYTCFCGWCQASTNWAKIRGKNHCGCEDCSLLPAPFWTRQFIRTRKHMEEKCMSDCCVFCFCTPCEICQEAREIKNGFGIPPPTEYYWSRTNQPLIDNKEIYAQSPQGYAPPPPPPAPQGYAPPPQGYAQPPPEYVPAQYPQ